MIISGLMSVRQAELEAQQKGFLGYADMQAAKDAGIANATLWKSRREQLEKQTQEVERAKAEQVEADRAKAEAEQAKAELAKAEACERDLQCIGNNKIIYATFSCRPLIERMAKNDFQWTDSWGELKFSRFGWQDKTNGIITYVGDKIKFQNSFGAWVRSIYECDYNFRTKSVVDIRVREGQLPPRKSKRQAKAPSDL